MTMNMCTYTVNKPSDKKKVGLPSAYKALPKSEWAMYTGMQIKNIATTLRPLHPLDVSFHMLRRAETLKAGKGGENGAMPMYNAAERYIGKIVFGASPPTSIKMHPKDMVELKMNYLKARHSGDMIRQNERVLSQIHWAIYPVKEAVAECLKIKMLDSAVRAATYLVSGYTFDYKSACAADIAWALIVVERALELLPSTNLADDSVLRSKLEAQANEFRREIGDKKLSPKDMIMIDFANGKINQSQAIERVKVDVYGGVKKYEDAMVSAGGNDGKIYPAVDELVFRLNKVGHIKS